MKALKTLIQSVLRQTGYELHRYSPVLREESVYQRRRHLLRFVQERQITLLLDAGANAGQYARGLRDLGYRGRIVSFEPLAEAFSVLEKTAATDAQWQCRRVALGDADRADAEFHVAGYSECSSLLPMHARHVSALPASAYQRTEHVRVARLDSLRAELPLHPADRLWLKLDVQGYEKHVLLGAEKTLAQVQVIDTELSLVSLYDGQPLIGEMLTFLERAGFEPISLENGFIEPQTGKALQVDALFARRPVA